MDLLYKEEVFDIIGAAIEVHKGLGHGFLEAVYQEAFEIELNKKAIIYEKEKRLSITYRGNKLNKYYIADFVCFDKIIVEIKAINKLSNDNYAQVLNYLKVTGYKVGVLLNFGSKSLEYKRLIF